MIEEKPLRKLDVLTGGALGLLGGAIIAGALQMPIGGTYGGVDNPWYASPAAMPLLIGSALLACALTIIFQAVKRGGHLGLPNFLNAFWKSSILTLDAARGAMAWGSLLVYALALQLQPFASLSYPLRRIGATDLLADSNGLNYILCSALFLLAFALAFLRPSGRFPSLRYIAVLSAGSLVAAVLVAWTFSELLRVPLP
ncbi:hypothetical protein [Pelagicoccus sp. SDUM812005]|uniref:hypothetical protein n=1 Tax=Pelagicoccus sp. SDUM812005 TaxID=3041257 RepID=UPI00280F06BA|nr:hypothetical protein [Pelagicoccus sp. SDUM812005]MDQ8180629.1 hypothetical protein [Pelagicoccus sp. SDUM812005]